jgi:bifunctional oligoribonuclease and PAP phosphatase NrnA
MRQFAQEFNTLKYAIANSEKVLLFAHSHPDGDTVGAVLALKEYIKSLGKIADVACFDPYPESFNIFFQESFLLPEQIKLDEYKLIIACDSVERGFQKIQNKIQANQVVALLDHHPDIHISGDINIIDPQYSSVCEAVYDFFDWSKIKVEKKIATFLMLGIVSDTGMFQHSNTTSKLMEIASDLMKKGALISKIVEINSVNKTIATLRLWGLAFEKARINPANGMISSILTKKNLEECGATEEDISHIVGILNTVPGTKFALVLSERGDGTIKGSLRSEEYKGVDVSEIAAEFGGGGHKLASGFEIRGKIVETLEGWKII